MFKKERLQETLSVRMHTRISACTLKPCVCILRK